MNPKWGHAAIMYKHIAIIKDPNGLLPTDFDNLEDIDRLVESFNPTDIIKMTSKAWHKYEDLVWRLRPGKDEQP
jgi:hypothetical protein